MRTLKGASHLGECYEGIRKWLGEGWEKISRGL